MKTEARSVRFVLLIALMIAAMVCSFTVMASADDPVSIQPTDLKLDGVAYDPATGYTKEYDGTTTVTVELIDPSKLPAGTVITGTLNSPNVLEAKTVTVTFKDASGAEVHRPLSIEAKVIPQTLTWNGNGTASVTYQYGKTSYAGLAVTLPTVSAGTAPTGVTVTVNGVSKAGTYTTVVNVSSADANYAYAPLTVDVTVEKIKIETVAWENEYVFAWGNAAAKNIVVYGYDAQTNGNAYKLLIGYPEGYGNVGTHVITAVLPDPDNMEWAQNNTAFSTKAVVITKAQYTVSLKDAVYVGNHGIQSIPTVFQLAVEGDIPADVRALIVYTCDGVAFAGASAYGSYNIVADLPSGVNYEFVDENGQVVSELRANMCINKQYVAAGTAEAPYQIILIGTEGFSGDVSATVTVPESIARKAIRGFRIHEKYTLTVAGAAGKTFTALIPISDDMYQERCEALTNGDLYVYDDLAGTMIRANEKYTVTLEEGFYRVEGVSGNGTVTFVIAPVYDTPFLLTAPGIALLVLLVLALIALMILVGLYLRRVRDTEENEAQVIDEGEVPAVEPTELEDTVSADEFLEETADEVAENLDVEAATDEVEPENVEEVVDETMQELLDEANAIEIVETDVVEEMVEDKAEELEETVEAENAEEAADEDAVREAVDEAMAELNESADASDAVEVVEDEAVEAFAPVEDADDDNDEDEEEESFGGFGSMPLDFIDAIAEADKYAEMLEQERRGEVQLVTRYKRSFQSRLIQSQGNVQDYYSIIKNALMSYKGVKNRISWNYEAFNRGRVHVAKINVKTKTLFLYLALDPAELIDTKYGIVDVSSKKKYASVPVLMKIKGERKFKYALELIAKLCGENLELPKLEVEETDYHVPYQTTEELVQAGVIKKLVASIPVTVYGETPAEEVADDNTAAAVTEQQEVTFIEPTSTPAVEAAAEEIAEEIPVEEVPAEEAPAEEVPADAPASEDEPKEV